MNRRGARIAEGQENSRGTTAAEAAAGAMEAAAAVAGATAAGGKFNKVTY